MRPHVGANKKGFRFKKKNKTKPCTVHCALYYYISISCPVINFSFDVGWSSLVTFCSLMLVVGECDWRNKYLA